MEKGGFEVMQRFLVQVLKRNPSGYEPTGQTREVDAMNEWDAGRKFFTSIGVVSLPTPAFALRVRRLTYSAS